MLRLSVIFCGYISHLIGHETINIPEIVSGVTGKTNFSSFELTVPLLVLNSLLRNALS